MIEPLKLENVQIFYRNFTGIQTALNRLYRREFGVKIDGRKVESIRKKGWTVNCVETKKKKEWYIPVTINNFYDPDDGYPVISMVLKNTKDVIELSDEDVKILDYVYIDNACIELKGYEWHVNDKHGVKAYLKFAMFTVDPEAKTKAILKQIRREAKNL